jgi:hypothetical protein
MDGQLAKMREAVRIALELIADSSLGMLEYDVAELHRQEQPFMVYQRPERSVLQDADNDRVFPLDTVSIQHFKTKYNVDIENAYIHIGPDAEEFTRMLHALAVTIGPDIFFRKSAYDPGSEEGRKTLEHELTHVAQYHEGRINPAVTKSELENEAEEVEHLAAYSHEITYPFTINGVQYNFTYKELKEIAHDTADYIQNWIESERNRMADEEYLNLLCKYERWLEKAVWV